MQVQDVVRKGAMCALNQQPVNSATSPIARNYLWVGMDLLAITAHNMLEEFLLPFP